VTDFALPGPVWLVGCGNMAGAMLEGWLAAGLDPARFTIVDPHSAFAAEGVRRLAEPPEDEVPALLMLGVKPQLLDEVAPSIAPACDPRTILVSMLAGTELASLRARFPICETIIRVMPNMPARLCKGALGLCSDGGDAQAREAVTGLMQLLGTALWFDEARFDAVTALSGSGPAFLYRFIDALAQAGVSVGLDPDQAAQLALATVEGSAALAALSGEDPGTLAERVASPGGSTRKGLDVLDADGRLVALLRETLEASVRRNREMAEESRRG
jgi:pyrroline-5-carboxylate reductase